MDSQNEIYHVLKTWIEAAKKRNFDKFSEFRSQFGQLEKKTFGDVSERVRNPVAMKYEIVRNELVRYSGDKNPKDLELARKDFLKIQNPRISSEE